MPRRRTCGSIGRCRTSGRGECCAAVLHVARYVGRLGRASPGPAICEQWPRAVIRPREGRDARASRAGLPREARSVPAPTPVDSTGSGVLLRNMGAASGDWEKRFTRRTPAIATTAAGAAAAALPAGARGETPGALERGPARRRRRRPTSSSSVPVSPASPLRGRSCAPGHSVVVLEARERVGGRTWNRPITGGSYIDAGAEFVGPTQDRIKALAQAVGVETFPTYNTGSERLLEDGTRQTYAAAGPTGVAPPDPLSAAGPPAGGPSGSNTMAQQIDVEAPWEAKEAEDWDSQTFYTWVKANEANPEFQRLVAKRGGGDLRPGVARPVAALRAVRPGRVRGTNPTRVFRTQLPDRRRCARRTLRRRQPNRSR